MLPFNDNSEKYVLGCIMAFENTKQNAVDFGLEPEYFYSDLHKNIYEASLLIEKVDISLLVRKLGDIKLASYLSDILTTIGTDVNLKAHIEIMKADYLKRKVIEYGFTNEKNVRLKDIDDIISEVNAQNDEINRINVGEKKIISLLEISENALKETEKRADYYKKYGEIEGIKTNISALDNTIFGLRKNKLIILGGRPGMGKTAFALKLAKEVSNNNSVLFFSLEMNANELVDRLILSNTNIDPNSYQKGSLSTSDWNELNASQIKISNNNITIIDDALITIDKIRAKALLHKRKNNCDVVIIDYLQLIDTKTDNKQYNKTNEVGELSRKCKLLAKELDITVILLSQLNREVEKRTGKKPTLSDLRDSGNIEQDADIVLFCYRPNYYNITEDENGQLEDNYFELIVAKHRGGEIGTIKLHHTVGLTDFYERQQSDFNFDVRSFTEPAVRDIEVPF